MKNTGHLTRLCAGLHLLIGLLVAAGAANAGWDFPEPFTTTQIDSLTRVHRDEGALILFVLTTADLHYDRGRQCVRDFERSPVVLNKKPS